MKRETLEPEIKLIDYVQGLKITSPELYEKILLGPTKLCNIKKTARLLKEGKVALIYASTTYCFAANGYIRESVERIFQIKGRALNNPLPVLSNVEQLERWVVIEDIYKKTTYDLVRKYWPGGLGVIFNKRTNKKGQFIVPEFVTPNTNSVCLGCQDMCAYYLSREADFPIAITSANYSKQPSVTNPFDAIKIFKDKVDVFLLGPESKIGMSSTLIDFSERIPRILRKGPLFLNELKNIIPEVIEAY